MSIPDPPWKKKTRPCPFYSQGRCVFAESCGFLHDVKVKSTVGRQFTTVVRDAKSPQGSISSVDSVIEAPQTIAVHSPTLSFSSPRSPRMANLLSALQGIIGPDPQESTELSASVGEKLLYDTPDSSHLLPDAVKGTDVVRDENMGQGGDAANRSGPQNDVDIIENVRDFTNATSTAGDSGIPEGGMINVSSPPGLLSPVQIGTVAPLPFPHVASACDDSIDSWVGPTPFSLSPPHLSRPGSTLDLLTSPFGSPVSCVLSRRLSSSAGRKQSSLTTLRGSIVIAPPPSISTIDSQHNIPSTENTDLMPASQAWHSPLHPFPPEQQRSGDAIPSNRMADESGLSVDVSNSSHTDRRLVTTPSSDILDLKNPIPMTSRENIVDTPSVISTIPNKDSSCDQEKYLPIILGGTVGGSQVPSQLSSTGFKTNQREEPLPTPTVDVKATCTHSTSVSENSPVSLGTTAKVREFDYEALHQSLAMSPEETASKHRSSASCSSPPRTSTLSFPSHTVVHADVPRRSHSSVDLLRLHVAPALLSEYNSHTSTPLPETPVSSASASSQANASTQSIQIRTTPFPLSTTGLVARSSPLVSPRLPAEKAPPLSPPIAGPSRGVKTLLDDRYEPEPETAASVWNSVSTSRKVPFGFRYSITSEKGPPAGSAPRKRPSVLSLTPVTSTDRFETPDSARSISSQSSQSKPSWARPLHLSQSFEAGPAVYRPSSYRESLASFTNPLPHPPDPDPMHPQHCSPSSSHSSHSSPHIQNRNNLYSENHISSVLTHNALKSAPLPHPHTKTWHNSLNLNFESHDKNRRPAIRPSPQAGIPMEDDASESGDQLLTFSLGPISLPSAPPKLRQQSSLFTLVPSSATTPERSLIFAIASDNVDSVRQVLEHSHADPNESVGPQSALAFALTNERLAHKLDIVKALLAHGANPAALRNPELNPPHRDIAASDDTMLLSPPPTTTLEAMDPATRYYVSRADAPQTRHLSTLLQKSLFRPLGRVRYDIIGQDRVFEQLFTVLNQHSRTLSVSPLVLLLCGPSGHGKSFLARRFGSLLGVPTHTVNVTTLQSTHDIWDSYSMSPYEELSTRTLSQFLLENEGKRCVVVLDEIEKVDEPRVLYSLLMPWELGRCLPKTGQPAIDVRQVVWLGTSNIGHDLVFEFCKALSGAGVSHEEYLDLVRLLRPKVSQCLGASLSSRVTAVLPFVPFTEAELMAIATEVFYSLGGKRALSVSCDVVERISLRAIKSYIPEEGARSLHRAISYLLTEVPELLEQEST